MALRIEIREAPLWVIEVYWKRLLVGGTACVLAGYLALVTAGWWARNPQSQVRWQDVALIPVRWDELTRRRGETASATHSSV